MTSDQIIFLDGKEEALKTLFSQNKFGYIAIGRQSATDTSNGFSEPDSNNETGFHEITKLDSPSYYRIPLKKTDKVVKDPDTGKVSMTFVADLDVDNIVEGIQINQFAICDNQDSSSLNTVFYCASVFPTFTKNEKIAISFEIEMKV